MHNRNVSSVFGTRITRTALGLVLTWIKPFLDELVDLTVDLLRLFWVRAIRGADWEWSAGYEVDAVLDSTKRRKAMRKLFGKYILEFLQNSHQRRRNICQVVSSLR